MSYPCVDTTSTKWTAKPYSDAERRKVLEKCGRQCFLFPDGTKSDPDTPHYPVCIKCANGRCRCCLSCIGLKAVYQRLIMAMPRYRGAQLEKAEILKERVVDLALHHATNTNACKWAISAKKTITRR